MAPAFPTVPSTWHPTGRNHMGKDIFRNTAWCERPWERGNLAKTPPKIATCSSQSASLRRDNYAEIQSGAVNLAAPGTGSFQGCIKASVWAGNESGQGAATTGGSYVVVVKPKSVIMRGAALGELSKSK